MSKKTAPAASTPTTHDDPAAAKNAFHEATDEWASAEYRMDVASTLAKRCLDGLE